MAAKKEASNWYYVLGLAIGVVIISYFEFTVGGSGCRMRWTDSTLAYRWHVMKGCQVETGKGWVPEDRVTVAY